MRLYTVCIDTLPVLTLSTDTELPFPDAFTTNPEIMEAHRAAQALRDRMDSIAPPTAKDRRDSDLAEIDEELDTWLGADLQTLHHEGHPLWNGDRDRVHVRDATTDEAEHWHTSHRAAINDGTLDAGYEDWLIYLVSVSDKPPKKFKKARK
jgi:hypothetical protein